jgi:hypothetical protein
VQGFGAFVAVNATDGTGRKAKNIICARALFADADSPDAVERCRAYVRTTGTIPTMVIRTSPGRAHFYRCRSDIRLDVFTPLQSSLRDKLQTDNVFDLPRVMRLPGSLHLKQPDRPCLVTLRVFS